MIYSNIDPLKSMTQKSGNVNLMYSLEYGQSVGGLQSTRRAEGGSRQSLIISDCPYRRPGGQG